MEVFAEIVSFFAAFAARKAAFFMLLRPQPHTFLNHRRPRVGPSIFRPLIFVHKHRKKR